MKTSSMLLLSSLMIGAYAAKAAAAAPPVDENAIHMEEEDPIMDMKRFGNSAKNESGTVTQTEVGRLVDLVVESLSEDMDAEFSKKMGITIDSITEEVTQLMTNALPLTELKSLVLMTNYGARLNKRMEDD